MHPTPEGQFAVRMRECRLAAKMSQAELARRLSELMDVHVVATAITKIESGARTVRLDEAVYAAQVLGVPLTALVSEKDPREARLDELRRDVARQEERASGAEWEIGQAQSAIAHLKKEIAELEGSPEG